ncbi:MAG: C40 family peptidase [Bacteroidales bacterium]|nr:C40 family peptidase [Bacteroidales bacterium]
MTFAVCTVGIMPLRAVSDDRSEMVSQVFFGEIIEVKEQSSNWAYIRVNTDRYEGWVDPKQFAIIDELEMNRLSSLPLFYTSDLVQLIVSDSSKQMIPLVVGSHLPGFADNMLTIAGEKYHFEGGVVASDVKTTRKLLSENAMMFINASYLWGGKTPFGVDCSGLTQTVYKISGVKLSRDASMQAKQGEIVNFITDALIGDLAFFDNEDGNIIHVGILLGDNKILHASGKVRIDAIDHQGIFNVTTKKYTHKLRLIRSYL